MNYTLYCDQCQPMNIQGIPCHEKGCPNKESQWIKRVRGFDVPVIFPEGHAPEYLRKGGGK